MKTLFDYNLTLEEAQELIRNGADVNEAKPDKWSFNVHTYAHAPGMTPLFYVKNTEIAKLLIENGADIKATIDDDDTLLHFQRNANVIKLLIEKGIDLNKRNCNGNTPLHLASNVEIIKVLIEHGADLNPINHDGETPLDVVLYNEYAIILISIGVIAGKINTYKRYREYFSNEQQKVFDAFMSITGNDDDFFQMCLAYQNDHTNSVKIEIKEMEIQ